MTTEIRVLPGWTSARWLRGLAARLVPPVAAGSLEVRLPSGGVILRRGLRSGPAAVVTVHRKRAFRRVLLGGALGFAEAYVDGDLSSPDIGAVIDWGLANESEVDPDRPVNRAAAILDRVRHALNANTRRGSRRNIAAHYDLGNGFYARWLDAGMQYSSALYRTGVESLEEAQAAKLERVAALLDLSGGERVLEIGCGWGALAEHLALRHGAAVTGITLSAAQRRHAAARLTDLASGSAEIRIEDYRDVAGRFDRVVSIEMLEAVGERYWPVYFLRLRELLAEGGVAVLQAITIEERRFAAYRARPDFIQRHIFPGGMLPTVPALRREAERAGFRIVAEERFGRSYAETLAVWRARFLAAWPEIATKGFDERFRRLWTYYLLYCEAGFRAGAIDVGLYRLEPG